MIDELDAGNFVIKVTGTLVQIVAKNYPQGHQRATLTRFKDEGDARRFARAQQRVMAYEQAMAALRLKRDWETEPKDVDPAAYNGVRVKRLFR